MINGGKTKTILQKSKTVMKIPLLQKPKKKTSKEWRIYARAVQK